MAERRVRLSPAARQDIIDIGRYLLNEAGSAPMESLLRQIDEAIRSLVSMPNRGSPRDEISPGLRSLSVKSYLVLYEVNDAQVRVLRVLHMRRDLPRASR